MDFLYNFRPFAALGTKKQFEVQTTLLKLKVQSTSSDTELCQFLVSDSNSQQSSKCKELHSLADAGHCNGLKVC